MKGGRCVTVLNTGTNNRPATPMMKTNFRSPGEVGSFTSWLTSGLLTSPFMVTLKMPSGTNKQTNDGTNKLVMMTSEVNWLPIQSMVVVMSPIGDQAPPAFAAMTTTPAKTHRVSLSSTNFLNSETMTMEVVRLSKTAEKKNVRMLKIQINRTLLSVLIRSVITEKPSCASTSSTMVMAPNKKKRIDEMSSMWWRRRCSKK